MATTNNLFPAPAPVPDMPGFAPLRDAIKSTADKAYQWTIKTGRSLQVPASRAPERSLPRLMLDRACLVILAGYGVFLTGHVVMIAFGG